MSITVSTKFKELILGPNSFGDIFNGGQMLLYSGIRPASPDQAAVSSPVARVTNEGLAWLPNDVSGLQFTQAGAWISKSDAQNWKLVGLADSQVTWFRLYGNSELDVGGDSLDFARLDGDASDLASADFVLPANTISASQILVVQQFLYSLAPL